jgi:3'-phosphoadenosine 5'-phosphosulfate (PAPS) 3'-phosphatase
MGIGSSMFARCMPNAPPSYQLDVSTSDGVGLTQFLGGQDSDALEFAAEKRAALEVVVKVCQMCRRIQKSLVSEETVQKKDRSPVTVADYAAQAVIVDQLTTSTHFKAYPIIAEEDSQVLAREKGLRQRVLRYVQEVIPEMTEQRLLDAIEKGNCSSAGDAQVWWTLDPIDGTLGFLRCGQYAVALALMRNNEPVLGVLGCPALECSASTLDEDDAGADAVFAPSGVVATEDDDDDDDDDNKQSDDGVASAVSDAIDATSSSSSPVAVAASSSSPVTMSRIGCVLVAAEGCGAFEMPLDVAEGEERRLMPIFASGNQQASAAIFTESRAHASAANQRVQAALGSSTAPVRIDSQCKYAMAARGQSDVYLRFSPSYQEKIWDHAAGHIIVVEAGGAVTDWHGVALDYSRGRTLENNTGIVCTNGYLQDDALAAIVKAPPTTGFDVARLITPPVEQLDLGDDPVGSDDDEGRDDPVDGDEGEGLVDGELAVLEVPPQQQLSE